MKLNSLFLIPLLLLLGACNSEPNVTQNTEPTVTNQNTDDHQPSSAEVPDLIDPETDFILEYNVGIINGTQSPDSVKIAGNGRYFDYGSVEVRTQGHSALSGENIQYRPKGMEEWIDVSQENHLFFLGYDAQKHLIIDKGSSIINRDIRLFDIQNGNFSYYTKYNNVLLKNGWLYVLRFVNPDKIDNLPTCEEDAVGYEEVVAIHLNNYQEAKTNQVFCVYKQ
ncbi:MAG: hypothetical protein MI974_11365 [Chitinophagales bacterium]|nr:hypothetical protein [Chitinophagales bacterium]